MEDHRLWMRPKTVSFDEKQVVDGITFSLKLHRDFTVFCFPTAEHTNFWNHSVEILIDMCRMPSFWIDGVSPFKSKLPQSWVPQATHWAAMTARFTRADGTELVIIAGAFNTNDYYELTKVNCEIKTNKTIGTGIHSEQHFYRLLAQEVSDKNSKNKHYLQVDVRVLVENPHGQCVMCEAAMGRFGLHARQYGVRTNIFPTASAVQHQT